MYLTFFVGYTFPFSPVILLCDPLKLNSDEVETSNPTYAYFRNNELRLPRRAHTYSWVCLAFFWVPPFLLITRLELLLLFL